MTDTNITTTAPASLPAANMPRQDQSNEPSPPLDHSELNPFRESALATAPPTTSPPPSSPPIPGSDTRDTDGSNTSPQNREGPVSPQIAALRAMFPDYDDLILQSVLDSVDGDQNRAIDTLLGMGDPDYRSEPAAAEQPPLSQAELDEQFARRLMLEEQEQHQAAWEAQEVRRAQRAHSQRIPPQPQSAGGDTMGEFQQQFSKIAETGKKTFGTIFSKVKAKIQELDQPRQGQSSTWGGADPNQPQSQYQHQYHPQLAQPQPQLQQSQPSPYQQPAYYDPNPYSAPHTPPPTTLNPSRNSPPQGIQGYDVNPESHDGNSAVSPPVAAPVPSTGTINTSSSIPPTSTTPRPPQTQTGPSQGMPIDGGKFGLLPKRPVSLLPSQSPAQMQRSQSETDSDELEYTENPFEEHKK